MKIRYFIVFILVIILGLSVYLLVDFKKENNSLLKKYNEINDIVRQNEIDKEVYASKVHELDELKESKKDKVLKYEEVEKWNQEIKQYLD